MKRITHSLLGAVTLVLLVTACSQKTQVETEETHFINVKGTSFTYKGEAYEYVGTNFWFGAYLGMEGAKGNRARLKRELDFLAENGITNLRILGASEEAEFQNSLKPVFIHSDGTYDEDLLVGLDFLLAEMEKRDMTAVIFLNNFWEWSGGMSTYLSWHSDQEAIDPADGDWTAFMRFSASFYTNEKANAAFRDYIKTIIQRKNTITGNIYSSDSAIMAWQLANEPRPGQGEESMANVPDYAKWIDESAAYIKSLDSNHLVSSGSEGEMGSLGSVDVYIDAHDTPNIDYLTFHMWAKNWSWIDPLDMEGTFQQAKTNASKYISDHVKIAGELNKPIVMEEFGFPRDEESYERGSSVNYRNLYYEMVFENIEKYDAFAGSNFWSWGGFGEAQNEDYWWKPGDPFTGDPPQEPQGLNSVFADDSTTISIIRNHAKKIKNNY